MQKAEEKHREDPVGYPDFTKPITIVGCIIEAIPIDIKAQTVGNIAIDIAAQTMGNVAVNIAASAVTLNVNIAASAVTFDVNISGGVSSARAGIGYIVNSDFEEGEAGWIWSKGAEVSDVDRYHGAYACRFPAGSSGASIEQYGVFPPVDTRKLSGFHVAFLVYNEADTARIRVFYSDGSEEYTWLTGVQGEWVIKDINFTTGKYITGVEAFRTGTPLDDVFFDTFLLQYDIEQMVGTPPGVNLNVSIQKSVVTVDINIASSAVTLNVNIESQTVDINIKTSGGVNIIIDKLTQTAYTERRSTLSNNGVTPLWAGTTQDWRRGKFFPRGCRGFIDIIEVYCYDSGTAGGTITVYISPHPSMGPVASANITVPSGGAAAWRSATFNRMWNYDSLFIFTFGSSGYMRVAYDNGAPFDYFASIDGGVTWSPVAARYWFRVVMAGETVGDVPVSGTINTIEIPAVSDIRLYAGITLTTDDETTIKTVHGAGYVEWMYFRADAAESSHNVSFRVYCDGSLAFVWSFATLNSDQYTATTPVIQLLRYTVDGICMAQTTIKFSFTRELKITFRRATGKPNVDVFIEGTVNRIK